MKKIYFLVIFSISLNLFVISSAVSQNRDQPYVEKINILNAKADADFIKWKLENNAPHLTANLKKILGDPKKIDYLAKQAQLPFNKIINNSLMNRKINEVIKNFKNNFKSINLSKQEEQKLRDFLRQLILPEIAIFDINSKDNRDGIYENFMKMLSTKKTDNGGNLAQWSQRFLTSQSLIVALPILQKQIPDNKNYYNLSQADQDAIINNAAHIVTEQYLSNVQAWKEKFNIPIPENLSKEVERKVVILLKLKLQPF